MLYGTILASKESKSIFNRYLRDPIKHVSFAFIDNKKMVHQRNTG